MTSQTSYWNRLIQPGIVALVGAGGKTTVLSKLVEYGRLKGQPIVVTTTTRLYESQVAHYKPIYTQNINEADEYCTDRVLHGYCCLLYTSPSPRDPKTSRMPSSA